MSSAPLRSTTSSSTMAARLAQGRTRPSLNLNLLIESSQSSAPTHKMGETVR